MLTNDAHSDKLKMSRRSQESPTKPRDFCRTGAYERCGVSCYEDNSSTGSRYRPAAKLKLIFMTIDITPDNLLVKAVDIGRFATNPRVTAGMKRLRKPDLTKQYSDRDSSTSSERLLLHARR